MFQVIEKKVQIGDQEIFIETGRIARQAGGSVLVTCGGTQVLVAATAAKQAQASASFFPLSVDYIEKIYSAGRIPGGYFKRETKPTDREVLTSRLIDRPIRPLFPETYLVETQVVATVMSYDPEVSPSMLAILGTSAALHISDIPFAGPVAGVRVGFQNGKYLINPAEHVLPNCELDLVVAGTKDAILMVEAAANFLSEEQILEAINVGHQEIKKLCAIQEKLRQECGKEKRTVPEAPDNAEIRNGLNKKFSKAVKDAYLIPVKAQRKVKIDEIKTEALAALVEEGDATNQKIFNYLFEMLEYKTMRDSIIKNNKRIDGRTTTDIRNIDCQVGILKRTHGSALFTRGETQSIGVVTLGTSDDAQKYESIDSVLNERPFMLHYNMPGYSVGEVKRLGSPGRREVGHGNLAERALKAALPAKERFPYSIRIVSEITESNGSSSMATVCSGTLSMLHAGVPLKQPIAGIAMGLVLEGKEYAVLSDILGDEDNLGDMDFKVAGGKNGITAMQMDIKIEGISTEILQNALAQAKEGRLLILDKMLRTISKPNDLSSLAPRIEQIKIKPDRVRDLIGPGGKNIKKIVADTGCKLEVNDEGIVSVASTNGTAAAKAKRMIQYLTTDPEIGEIYLGVVKKTADFGAFVEIKPGVEGLVHISQLAANRVNKTEDVVKEGEEILVKVIELDRSGKIKLSRKDAIGKSPTSDTRAWVV